MDYRDFRKYKSILKESKKDHGFLLHNYAVMNNHGHLLIRLESTLDISKIMHSINRWYARWYNEYYDRKGHFWEGRFYGELIKDDEQLLAVMRYMDLNPVRAGMCTDPSEYKHSGAKFYLKGIKEELIDVPEIYLTLGETPESRQKAYSDIFPINLLT